MVNRSHSMLLAQFNHHRHSISPVSLINCRRTCTVIQYVVDLISFPLMITDNNINASSAGPLWTSRQFMAGLANKTHKDRFK